MTPDDPASAPEYVSAATPILRVWNGDPVALHVSIIDLDRYRPALFAEQRVAMPDTIGRSVPKRQAEYLHGRLAARNALAPFGLAHFQVGTGPSREPLWPAGIIGSISHNRRLAAAVALDSAMHGAIGIDVESIVDAATRDALQRTALSPCEVAVLERACPTLPLEWLLTVAFSAKESFFKAAFADVGRYFDFDAIALRTFDWLRHELVFEVREALSARWQPGALVRIGYVKLDTDTVCTFAGWGPGRQTSS
jgi:4'-phosphopantetheinyl transferase EntD